MTSDCAPERTLETAPKILQVFSETRRTVSTIDIPHARTHQFDASGRNFKYPAASHWPVTVEPNVIREYIRVSTSESHWPVSSSTPNPMSVQRFKLRPSPGPGPGPLTQWRRASRRLNRSRVLGQYHVKFARLAEPGARDSAHRPPRLPGHWQLSVPTVAGVVNFLTSRVYNVSK